MNVLKGLGILALIVVIFATTKTAVDSFMTTILASAPGAGPAETFILANMSWWGLIIAFVAAFLIMRRK